MEGVSYRYPDAGRDALREVSLAVLLSDKLGVGPSSAPATSDPAQAAWRDRIHSEAAA